VRGASVSTEPAALADATPSPASLNPRGVGLFARTFFLLAALLLVSILAWLQTLRVFELEPRAVQTARQIASIVNLSRAALIHSDSIARVSLIKTMTEQEAVRILPREPADRFVPFPDDALSQRMTQELESRLGAETVVANSVNDEPGLWIGFTIDEDRYWMLTDRARLNPPVGQTWIIWLVIAAALSLAGAALIAGLINRPLRELSVAASRVREGDFAAGFLDETVTTREIREVNVEFNRMSRKLAQIEQDRLIMLAGISHDLRTPLARLRLETELSVADTDARDQMAADIDQANAIINKFLDYARPDQVTVQPIVLSEVVDRCVYALKDASDIRLHIEVPPDLSVLADEVDLIRALSNLLENASAGLGLAIVEKNIQRMGGTLLLRNRASGGLSARIELNRASKSVASAALQ